MSFLLVTPDCRVLCSRDVSESHPELARVLASRESLESATEDSQELPASPARPRASEE